MLYLHDFQKPILTRFKDFLVKKYEFNVKTSPLSLCINTVTTSSHYPVQVHGFINNLTFVFYIDQVMANCGMRQINNISIYGESELKYKFAVLDLMSDIHLYYWEEFLIKSNTYTYSPGLLIASDASETGLACLFNEHPRWTLLCQVPNTNYMSHPHDISLWSSFVDYPALGKSYSETFKMYDITYKEA